jgi:hypothetical protein
VGARTAGRDDAEAAVATLPAVEAAVLEEPKEPELSANLAPLDISALQPARPGRSEPAKTNPKPVPVRIPTPSVALSATSTHAEFSLGSAGLAPAGDIHFQAANGAKPVAHGQPAEPLAPRRQSVAFVRGHLPVADHSGLALADLAEMDAAPLTPVVPHRNGQPKADVFAPLACKTGGPSFVSCRLKFAGEAVAELMNALQVSAEQMHGEAIQAIQESFRQAPAMCLLAPPSEVVTAPAPPAAKWLSSQKPIFTAVAPENVMGRATLITGPQTPTLAGPSLPPQLLNLHQQNSSLRGNRKRMSSWPISFVLAVVLILGVGGLFRYSNQDRDAKAASAPPPVQTTRTVLAAPRARVVEEHPAARSVEVAGVRVVTGANKRPQVQFIVINHSSAELNGLNIRIAIRSVDGREDAPLFSVSTTVAALGPNQSKELRTDLDPSIQPSDLPDWQSLRTEVLVARQ